MATLQVVLDSTVRLSRMADPASLPGRIAAARRHGSLDIVRASDIFDAL